LSLLASRPLSALISIALVRAVRHLAAFDELTAQQRDATSLRTKIAPQIGDVARDINSKMQDEGESLLMMALGLNVLLVPWA
jgi:hypothetical protein